MVKNNKLLNEEIKLSPRERAIEYLIENKNPQSILAVSGAISLDYKNLHNMVNELRPRIISLEKAGNTSLIKLNLVSSPEVFSVESKRTNKFLRDNKKLELVRKDIESLNYPFLIALIFGSYVKKTKTNKSDIDICIICDDTQESKRLMSKLELLPIKLEIHNFSVREFESMLRTKEDNIGKEIVQRNIILYGIENYYNLISKWMKKE